MRFLVVFAHPQQNSFQARVHRCALETLQSRGHEVDDFDLYAENFQQVLTTAEMETYHDIYQNMITVKSHVDRLLSAEGLVFIFPTWWYGMPAILKGYLDRVWLPGVCFNIVGRRTYPLLNKITRLIVITTYGSSYWFYKLYLGDQNRKIFTRGIGRLISSKAKITWLAKYHMDIATPHEKDRFLSAIRQSLCKF
jgi:putative NADPH-quinone reductase